MAAKALFPLLLIVPFLVPTAVMWLWIKLRERRAAALGIKHPLANSDLLRPAAYSTSNALEEKRWELIEAIFHGAIAALGGALVFGTLSPTNLFGPWGAISAAAALSAVILIRPVMRVWGILPKLRDLRLGVEGEMATAEELNRLMLHGFRVYHDMPADGFNIDHVVIGTVGVFAVETKARAKRKIADDLHYKAIFDGTSLRLAGRSEDKSLEQARRQAKWLSRWLEKAVGEPVRVRPCLAFPGWFVELKGRSDVVIFSPRQANATFPSMRDSDRLSREQIERISFQVERQCRDIKPRTGML